MSQFNLFDESATSDESSTTPASTLDAAEIEAVPPTPLAEAVAHVIADERGVPPADHDPLPPATRVGGGQLPKRVVVIDGHALAYRSYFALSRGSDRLQTASGEATHAVFGFMKTLLKHVKLCLKNREGAVIVVFDPPVKTFRHELFDQYKAGRAETPNDLPGQVRRIKTLVDALGIARLELNGFEADDVIGTIAYQAEHQGVEVYILTSDRDAYQLLSDKVKVISSDERIVGPDQVKEKYGVTVSQWVDYRALTGDSSDNIPGAKGIGPKGAQKLLEANGSLEFILANLDTIEPKKEAQKVKDSLENVLFSQQLSRIIIDLPIELDLAAATEFKPDTQQLFSILNELQMNSVIKDVQALMGAPVSSGTGARVSGFESAPAQARVVNTQAWCEPGPDAIWGYSLENENDPVGSGIKQLAFADAKGVCVAQNGERPTAPIRAVNAKALAIALQLEPSEDPLLMAWVLDPNNTDIKISVQRYLGEEWSSDAATRAAQSRALFEKIKPMLVPELLELYETLELPTANVLARMESRGIRIDSDYFKSLALKFGERLQQLEVSIHELAGEKFNISSRDQLETILYDKLQLASGKKTKISGKRSTAVAALEPLREEHPIVEKILEWREISKLKGTYLEPLPTLINPHTGRLHTVFNQLGTATGRVSSINPNLQNIPVRTEVGREIRKGFIAADGFKLISADYSQIELRILAHITKEPALIEGFRNDEDIHRRTAAAILNIPLEQVTTDQRRGAKTVNYGVLYGMSAHRLARDEGIPYADAKTFIEGYFGAYPGIRDYLERTRAFCHEHGYVQDLFNRRRYIPEINAKAFPVREAAERAAINMPIQGTSAGIIKRAMIELEPELEALGARLLLQVHDELVIEVLEDRIDVVSNVVKEIMERAYLLDVPLGVGIGVGNTWYDAK